MGVKNPNSQISRRFPGIMYAKVSVYTIRANFKIEIGLFFSFAVKCMDAYFGSRYNFCFNCGENKYIRINGFK